MIEPRRTQSLKELVIRQRLLCCGEPDPEALASSQGDQEELPGILGLEAQNSGGGAFSTLTVPSNTTSAQNHPHCQPH